jgi:hypothetical protein
MRKRIGTPKPRHDWKVGDRVSFAASPAPDNRTAYTGTITSIDNGLANVLEEGWLANCAVASYKLFLAGAYIVQPSGPMGIRWFDTCDGCKKQLSQVDVDSNDREAVNALNVGFVCLACQEHAAGFAP